MTYGCMGQPTGNTGASICIAATRARYLEGGIAATWWYTNIKAPIKRWILSVKRLTVSGFRTLAD